MFLLAVIQKTVVCLLNTVPTRRSVISENNHTTPMDVVSGLKPPSPTSGNISNLASYILGKAHYIHLVSFNPLGFEMEFPVPELLKLVLKDKEN